MPSFNVADAEPLDMSSVPHMYDDDDIQRMLPKLKAAPFSPTPRIGFRATWRVGEIDGDEKCDECRRRTWTSRSAESPALQPLCGGWIRRDVPTW